MKRVIRAALFLTKIILTDGLKTIGINIHQLVGFQQRFDAWPNPCEQRMKIISAEIAESQAHYPGRRRLRNDPI